MKRRQRQQVQIVRLAIAGDTERATALIAEHLAEFPDDELIGSLKDVLLTLLADPPGQERPPADPA